MMCGVLVIPLAAGVVCVVCTLQALRWQLTAAVQQVPQMYS